jgi:hypothetical protein
LTKNNRTMSDDAIDSMEAGDPRDRGDDSAMEEDASNDNERESGRGRILVADERAVLPDGEEKDEEVGDDGGAFGGALKDDDGGGASPAAKRVITVEECLKFGDYRLHHACQCGASIKVIKYLVEEADSDEGKELLCKADGFNGMYPLHLACWRGASLNIIKYLVEERWMATWEKSCLAKRVTMACTRSIGLAEVVPPSK